jgi:ribosomal protein S17E
MTTTMAALSSPSIRHAEFVRLTLPSATYTFCNAAAPVTVNGITFTNLGSLLGIADIQRDIKATSNDLNISLTGIDPTNIGIILSSEIKGSTIEIWRGFLDDNNQIILTPTQQFFKRYQGIINSVSITEQFDDENRIRTATCVLSSSSIRNILENRIAGIITNKSNWQKLYPNDTSMNRVQSIIATYFDFGKKPKKGSQAVADTTTAEE